MDRSDQPLLRSAVVIEQEIQYLLGLLEYRNLDPFRVFAIIHNS
jgi:hypothetical protein